MEVNKRAGVFGWIMGLFSASHVMGNFLARFLPERYIFEVCMKYHFAINLDIIYKVICECSLSQVSIALLIFCPVYIHFYLAETVILSPRGNESSPFMDVVANAVKGQYKSMRYAANMVFSRYAC